MSECATGRRGEIASLPWSPTRPFTHSPYRPLTSVQFVFDSLSLTAASGDSAAKVDLVSRILPLIPLAVMIVEPPLPICPEYVPCLLLSMETSDKSDITFPLIP